MNTYDTLPDGSQVKCWECESRMLVVDRLVPDLGMEEYVVLLREGGYVKVEDRVIVEIVEDDVPRFPEDFKVPCIDKWGSTVRNRKDLKKVGALGENYYSE